MTARLAALGITVVPQYGVGGYRVDFAAAHPDDPSRMILAVEADGARLPGLRQRQGPGPAAQGAPGAARLAGPPALVHELVHRPGGRAGQAPRRLPGSGRCQSPAPAPPAARAGRLRAAPRPGPHHGGPTRPRNRATRRQPTYPSIPCIPTGPRPLTNQREITGPEVSARTVRAARGGLRHHPHASAAEGGNDPRGHRSVAGCGADEMVSALGDAAANPARHEDDGDNRHGEQGNADIARDEARERRPSPCSPVRRICRRAICPQTIAGMQAIPVTNAAIPQTSAATASPFVGRTGRYCWYAWAADKADSTAVPAEASKPWSQPPLRSCVVVTNLTPPRK